MIFQKNISHNKFSLYSEILNLGKFCLTSVNDKDSVVTKCVFMH
jgi:hypothetical protein